MLQNGSIKMDELFGCIWKGEKFWVGKLMEHPGIMTQGETLEELEDNMRDTYAMMILEDVPERHEIKELAMTV